jgi:small subunit ribosomal protein S6
MLVAANVYEGMFILDSNRYSRDQAAVSGQIPEMIQKLEGEILASRLWEERRLAYPIDGHRKGTYWLTYFKLDGGQLANLTRQCQLSESILRTLFLKVDPRIADALVSHALAGGTSSRRSAEVAAATATVAVEAADSPADSPAEADDSGDKT